MQTPSGAVMVNTIPRPPGRMDGYQWRASLFDGSGLVNTVGSPPRAGTLMSSPANVANTMLPSSPQLAPRMPPQPVSGRVE